MTARRCCGPGLDHTSRGAGDGGRPIAEVAR